MPIEKLDKQVLLDATGRIGGYDVSLKQYDVLSVFSMSYRGQRVNDVALAGSPSGDLPPFPETVRKRLARKGPWCVEPWVLLKGTGYEPPQVLSQHAPAEALCQQTEPIGVEEPEISDEDETEDEGFLFLSGATRKRRATSFAREKKRRKEKQRVCHTKDQSGK